MPTITQFQVGPDGMLYGLDAEGKPHVWVWTSVTVPGHWKAL